MDFYLCWTLFSLFGQMVHTQICNRNGKELCCSGYKQNTTTGRCEKCPPGFTGMDCAYQCGYLFYGDECSQKCDCPKELCNFVSGCRYITMEVNHTTDKEINESTEMPYPATTDNGPNNTGSVGQHNEKAGNNRGTLSVSMVFYTTVALIFVFVIFAMYYGGAKSLKYFSSKRAAKASESDSNLKEFGNSHYERVEYSRHI